MPEVVKVSTVESRQKLTDAIEEYFKQARYSDLMQVIGMHSILIDPQHAAEDQNRLYRTVLNMMKKKMAENLGKQYSSWYAEFPNILDMMISGGELVTNGATARIIDSRRAAFGTFASVDDFFFWALDDRRLALDEIVRYLEKTAERFTR